MPASSVSPSNASVERANARGMLQRAVLVEPVGHRERLAVVGDRDVAVAKPVRGGGHRLQIVAAVGDRRVHVKIAAQIGGSDRAAAARRASGSVDFAAVLAKLGRHPRHPERLVNAFFGVTRDAAVVVDAEQAVLVQLEARAESRGRGARRCGPSSR